MTKNKSSTAFYARYMGLAFQMFVILLAGWFVGSKIDQYFQVEKPYGALALTFLLLFGYFYKIYRDVSDGKL